MNSDGNSVLTRWKFPRDRFGDYFLRAVLITALAGLTCIASEGPARCAEKAKAGLLELTDQQLDRVSAGGTNLSVNLSLSATAQGPTATTSTQGSLLSAPTTVLLVNIDPQPGAGQISLQAVQPMDVTFASGQATAAGGTNRGCSASIDVIDASNIAFLTQTNSATVTPTSVTCSCAAFMLSRISQ